jgi:guanosine-3',5'-bis(diphosphate) 3'-pyrophosphohydrolase
VLHRLARKDIEDVLASVGRGELASADVMKAVFPDYKDERVTTAAPKPREEGWSKIRNAAGMLFQIPGRAARKDKDQPRDGAVPIRGVRGDLPVRFAPEGAVPGDRIVGAAGEAHVCAPLIALAECEVPAYPADRLPPELAAIPPVKPGSRNI